MGREQDLSKAISTAIEASYYLSPDAPGLRFEELVAVLRESGYGEGEIRDALRGDLANKVDWDNTGCSFTLEGLPVYMSEHAIPFAEDPRDWDTFSFVHETLQGIAREKGLAQASVGVSEILIEGQRRGLAEHQLRLAIQGLPMMKLATLAENRLTLTRQGQTWGALNVRQGKVGSRSRRQHFENLYTVVGKLIERRDPDVRWKVLRASIEAVPSSQRLALDHERVIDEICIGFADSGASVSLDDLVRRLLDVEVRSIVHGPLEEAQLVHSLPDTRVIPSLIAMRRHLDVFRGLWELSSEALQRAKELWVRKDVNVALTGSSGLLSSPRGSAPASTATKQLVLLIQSMSMRPALVPNSPQRVEIRDEIRLTSTVPDLLTYQIQQFGRRPAQVVMGAQPAAKHAPAVSVTQTKDQPMQSETLNILFLDLAGWSKLAPPQIVSYLERALPRLGEIVNKFNCTHRNTWGDALVATFKSAHHAADCALDIREMFRRSSATEGVPKGLVPRISLHQGEVIIAHNPLIDRADIFGDAVHLAARLEPVTPKGQVYCTRAFADALDALDGIAPVAHALDEIDMAKGFGRIAVFAVTGPNEEPPPGVIDRPKA